MPLDFNSTGPPQSDEHDTPPSFVEPISNAVGGFDLDPCASEYSDIAEINLTKDDGGLRQWSGTVWMNPPYSEVADWMRHAETQHAHGFTDLIVCLVFARTSTQWFHKYVSKADLVCFVEGRLKFGGAEDNAPAPSMVVVYGDAPTKLKETLNKKGLLVDV